MCANNAVHGYNEGEKNMDSKLENASVRRAFKALQKFNVHCQEVCTVMNLIGVDTFITAPVDIFKRILYRSGSGAARNN